MKLDRMLTVRVYRDGSIVVATLWNNGHRWRVIDSWRFLAALPGDNWASTLMVIGRVLEHPGDWVIHVRHQGLLES